MIEEERSRPAGNDAGTPKDPAYLRVLFNNSAAFYDPVNRLTSLGMVDRWRREVVWAASLHPGDRVLDAFSGPGGLAAEVVAQLGPGGRLVLVDLSPMMLHAARKRLGPVLSKRGEYRPRVDFVDGDLLRQDLGLGEFDAVFLGWGLRYVEDVHSALDLMRSFLVPGGSFVVLEFTRPPRLSWAIPAHLYFRHLLPRVGSLLARDRELHECLVATATKFLSPSELMQAMLKAGFRVRKHGSHLDGLVTIIAATAD